MEIKIVAFGKNERIVNDICDTIKREKGIRVEANPLIRSVSGSQSLNNAAHLVIICLEDDSRFEIQQYDEFEKAVKAGKTIVAVIAGDRDKSAFMEATGLTQVLFLTRSAPYPAIYEKIDRIRQELNKREISTAPVIEEFVNPHPIDEFQRKHIMVVDDDPEQLFQIKENLKEFYDVTVVTNGRSALNYMGKHKVDLVLLDFIMPGMDGATVYSKMKFIPALRDIPVVFLTGVSDKEKVTKVLVDLAPRGYLLKPAKKSELVATIIEILG